MTKLQLSPDSRPVIMGILNVTPDSFSDGGKFNRIDAALTQAEAMLKAGAAIIDIGGESTRPGAPEVSEQDELNRVIPVITKLKQTFDCPISLDTSKAMVMQAGIEAGVDLINDVCALGQPDALEVAANCDLPICLMHMQGRPRTMQQAPQYQDVVLDVKEFFEQKIAICENAGIRRERLILDPGFGFGKTLEHNYELLNRFAEFRALGLPLLAGLSRKSMIGNLLNLDANERRLGSVVAATLAMVNGANILRVHDVAETQQAVSIFNATKYGAVNE